MLAGKPETALHRSVAAVSVGVIDGEPRLDLCYDEDVAADVDMNVVCTGTGDFVEVQGTGEAACSTATQLDALLDLGRRRLRGAAREHSSARRSRRERRMTLLLATRNAKKLVELRRILDRALGTARVELVGLDDVADVRRRCRRPG